MWDITDDIRMWRGRPGTPKLYGHRYIIDFDLVGQKRNRENPQHVTRWRGESLKTTQDHSAQRKCGQQEVFVTTGRQPPEYRPDEASPAL